MQVFQTATVLVPGANRVYEKKANGQPDYLKPKKDKHGHPIWDMPPPVAFAIHFKSEADKRKFTQYTKQLGYDIAAGILTEAEANKLAQQALGTATKQVPVYSGMSASLARETRSQARRSARIAAWKEFQEAVLSR